MASLTRVRRDFRNEVNQLISSGTGSTEKLVEAAGRHFGRDVGYEVLIKAFLRGEVSNAVSTLRGEGRIETIGHMWKPASQLVPADVAVISLRRLKRMRGELLAQVKLAQTHGLAEDVLAAGRMLEIVTTELDSRGDGQANEFVRVSQE